ncbi:sodium- and chloride-dependent GABA transporter 2-like [Limulus polyphemus]|uniref:Sodium- and chloride-dependent GABA transporter 2-like n=1 Tax=Limulus polyphemus TaxID=6850 RepID=A0ABM1BMA2_LIMPO|nr:sodium- and chloride-dependent GABA transporter 2-like [Limulus polyphemus]
MSVFASVGTMLRSVVCQSFLQSVKNSDLWYVSLSFSRYNTWIYGAKQICRNIQDMIGFQPNYYFVFCWIVAAPLVIMGIFLFSVLKYDGVTYANIYKYPWWGEMIGWGMSVAAIAWIPCYAIYYLLTTSGTLKERLKKGLSPVMVPSPVKELISVGTDENAEVQVAVVYKAEEEKPFNLN